MQTVWVLHYLNLYLVHLGVFSTEEDARNFVADTEHPDWYTPVELPIQPPGAVFDTMIKVKNYLPQGRR